MRIIAGKHRGKRLAEFRGEDVRPTPDRVKESLFQILEPRLFGARVLDLFAGTGALGLEALSRGASEAVFNDASRESVALLEKNLRLTGEKGKVHCLGFEACLNCLSGQFDLIFCDPPYRENFAASVLQKVAVRGLLKAESDVKLTLQEHDAENLTVFAECSGITQKFLFTKI